MTPPTDDTRADATRLKKLISKKRFDEIEATWMEALAEEPLDVEGLLSVLETLVRREQAEMADGLFWFLLSEVVEHGAPADGVELVRSASAYLTGTGGVRDEAAGLWQETFAATDGVPTMCEMTVLNAAVPFSVAVRRLDKLLALTPGSCAVDTQVDKVGQVVGLDPAEQSLELSFDDRPRRYDRVGIDKLEPLPAGDLRSRMVREREAMQALATEQPEALVKIVLGTYGPRLEFRDLKARLADLVSAKAWTKWWAEAKLACKRDPLIEMSDANQPWLFLRNRPVAYEAEIKATFDAAEAAQDKLVIVLSYLAECTDKAPDAEFGGHVARILADDAAAWHTTDAAMALGALAVLGELQERGLDAAPPEGVSLQRLVAETSDLAAAMATVDNDRLARSIVEHVRKHLHSAWHDVWAASLPGCSSSICDLLAQGLLEAGHARELQQAVDVVLARPERYGQAMAWLWKAVCSERLPSEVLAGATRFDVAISLLAAANALNHDTTTPKDRLQGIVTSVKNAISAKDFEHLRAALKETDDDGAVRAFHMVERCFVLGEHTRVRLMNIITQTHPEAFLKTVPPWEDEEVVYTTAAGLKKQQAEFTDLVHVKMAANAKAIGEAAARGDLSENAEFTAALEERNLLTEKAARMEADLQKSRIIEPSMVGSESVTVGSTVVARNTETGNDETMTFLGPWDSAPEQGVYSYRAAMAQAFMGKAVGDSVELTVEDGTRSWELLSTRPADQLTP